MLALDEPLLCWSMMDDVIVYLTSVDIYVYAIRLY